MIRLTSIFGGRLSILRDTLKEVDSRIRFFYLQSDYPELIEYRLKQSMPEKIARCFVTGSSEQKSRLLIFQDRPTSGIAGCTSNC
jgi:hypothetical protein